MGRDSEVEAFRYQLAEKLHKTLEEVDRMSQVEYQGWAAYLEAKGAFEQVAHG